MKTMPRKSPALEKPQKGFALPMAAIAMSTLVAVAGLGIDIGYVAYQQRLLNNAVDAAAMAGAQLLWDHSASDIKAAVISYAATHGSGGGAPTGYNKLSLDPTLVDPPEVYGEVRTSQNAFVSANATISGYNTIRVVQTAKVNLFFAKFLGPMTISATASAGAGGGGSSKPINAIIVMDTTTSMQSTDSQCGTYKIQCALDGAESMLKQLTSSQNQVALVTLPPLASSTDVDKDINNTLKNPWNPGSYVNTQTYMAGSDNTKPWLDSANSRSMLVGLTPSGSYLTGGYLNTANNLVKALGGHDKDGKAATKGIVAQGGRRTYISQAIKQAQSMLPAASTKYENAIILLSDGDANADTGNITDDTFTGYISGTTLTVTAVPTGSFIEVGTNLGTCSSSCGSGFKTGTFITKQTSGTFGGTGTYTLSQSQTVGSSAAPKNFTTDYDLLQCQQAVAAAREAKQAGTRIYVIGYDPSLSSGCGTDTTADFMYLPTGTTAVNTTPTTISGKAVKPCTALRWISGDKNQTDTSAPSTSEKRPYFFTTSSTCTTNNNINDIAGLFRQIGGVMAGARMIPSDDATKSDTVSSSKL